MVVAVTDGSLLSLAGRVAMPLAIALVLPTIGTSAQPGRTGAPPAQPAVHVAPQPHGVLGGQVPLVRAAARHGQRKRRGAASVGVPAAASVGTPMAITRP